MARDHLEGLDETHVSFSELSTLATCEEKWLQRYVLRRPDPPGLALRFGTVMHWLVALWWETGQVAGSRLAAQHEDVDLPETGQRSYAAADWLLDRYVTHYTPFKEQGWRHEDGAGLGRGEVSLWMPVDVPGVGTINLRGTADDFLVDPLDDTIALVERKTMSDWRRLDLVDVTTQETLYFALARANDIPVDHVVFDAIKSYQWTRDNHPPADSFQWLTLYRTDEQIEGALAWTRAILQRRADLYPTVRTAIHVNVDGKIVDIDRPIAAPIKNLGVQTCTSCAFQGDCWEALAFPHDVTIEVEDEEVDA